MNLPRILIVDDQADIRKLITLTLQHLENAELYEADNGGDGLRLALEIKPDLMLLDVMMPGSLDGYQVCDKVKKDPVLGQHTKVILLTARAQKDDLAQGDKVGCDGYLTKPFSPLKLLDLVDEMLGDLS
jgi:CheY-like chemotaxis protein